MPTGGVDDEDPGADDDVWVDAPEEEHATVTVGELTCDDEVGWVDDVICDDCDVVVLDITCGFLEGDHPTMIATRTADGWRAFSADFELAPDDATRLLDEVRVLTGHDDAVFPIMALDPACIADGADAPSTVAFGSAFRFRVGEPIDHVACAAADEPGTWSGGYALMGVRRSCVEELSGDPRWTVEGTAREPVLRFEGFAAHVAWTGTWTDLREAAGIAP